MTDTLNAICSQSTGLRVNFTSAAFRTVFSRIYTLFTNINNSKPVSRFKIRCAREIVKSEINCCLFKILRLRREPGNQL